MARWCAMRHGIRWCSPQRREANRPVSPQEIRSVWWVRCARRFAATLRLMRDSRGSDAAIPDCHLEIVGQPAAWCSKILEIDFLTLGDKRRIFSVSHGRCNHGTISIMFVSLISECYMYLSILRRAIVRLRRNAQLCLPALALALTLGIVEPLPSNPEPQTSVAVPPIATPLVNWNS